MTPRFLSYVTTLMKKGLSSYWEREYWGKNKFEVTRYREMVSWLFRMLNMGDRETSNFRTKRSEDQKRGSIWGYKSMKVWLMDSSPSYQWPRKNNKVRKKQ